MICKVAACAWEQEYALHLSTLDLEVVECFWIIWEGLGSWPLGCGPCIYVSPPLLELIIKDPLLSCGPDRSPLSKQLSASSLVGEAASDLGSPLAEAAPGPGTAEGSIAERSEGSNYDVQPTNGSNGLSAPSGLSSEEEDRPVDRSGMGAA